MSSPDFTVLKGCLVPESFKNPKVNVYISWVGLMLFLKIGKHLIYIKHFIYISTFKAYGRRAVQVLRCSSLNIKWVLKFDWEFLTFSVVFILATRWLCHRRVGCQTAFVMKIIWVTNKNNFCITLFWKIPQWIHCFLSYMWSFPVLGTAEGCREVSGGFDKSHSQKLQFRGESCDLHWSKQQLNWKTCQTNSIITFQHFTV